MTSHFSELIRDGMKKVDLDRKALIQTMGYRNRNKGFRRIDAWLSGQEFPNRELIEKLSTVLKVDSKQIIEAIKLDIHEMKIKAKEKRKRNLNYRLTIRAIPGFYISREISGSLTIDEAIQEAMKYSKGKCRFTLNTTENKTYWCSATGKIESISDGGEPYMTVGGRPFRFNV